LRTTLLRDDAGEPSVITGLVEDITSRVAHEHERDAMIERLQASLLFLHEPVSRVLKPGVFCTGDMPARKVAALLAEHGDSATLVRDASGEVIGIVTAGDLCTRVLAAGQDGHTAIRTVMSAPVTAVSGGTPVYESLLRMQETHLRHLGVADETGRLLGTLSDRDLMPFQQYGALVLTGEISRAALVEDVVRCCKRTPATVKALVDSGAHPRNVARLISEVCDAATERFVNLAIEELGPPPTRFAFLALGSQGRLEQTLVTDQDNAILYAPPEPGAQGPDPAHYFLELGQRVCGWLNEAGYPFCRGRFMAQNPVWTREIQAWKTHFSYWIARAEPKELLVFTVFFDFRAVCGDAALMDDLRQHVFAGLREASAFFPHFASDALHFKPPLMLFGHILLGNVRGAPRGTIDLKAASLPIVAFARLYALRHGIAQTSTLDRLDALAERGKLAPASRDEITATYTFLMRLRLRQQVLDFHAGRTPGNLISVRSLGYSDRTHLRQSFAHIRALQRSIDYDFLGGTHNNPS
jgi:CBS domain-containing protein